MAMASGDGGGSVTRWIDGLKEGEDAAATALWTHYFDGLVRLARGRLRDSPRAVADEEDVALSAFHCLCRGAAAGRFPELADRTNLWRLLTTITAQKALDERRRQGRERRGGGRYRPAADLVGAASEHDILAEVVGHEPTPEMAVLLDEQYRHMLDRLGDDTLRRIAVWKMEGQSNEEIAERMGCGLRTVERKLGVIRSVWLAAAPT
jgi:DNA-directed RNA polymerase specialized sigma24 family protein